MQSRQATKELLGTSLTEKRLSGGTHAQLGHRIGQPRRRITLSRERRFFNTAAPCVMELMEKGMDQTQLS